MGRRVLISGYYGYGNFGDEAILSVLTDRLHRLGSDITVLSHSPFSTSRTYGVKSVKNFNILSVLLAIMSCDVLVSGGGSLLQDVTSSRSLWYYSFIIKCALMFKKDVVIFAQGIGPIQNEKAKVKVLDMLRQCKLVSVRDEKSQAYLKAEGIDAILVSDPVFSVELPQNLSTGAVGIQLRSFRSVDDAFLFALAQQIIDNFIERKIELYVFQESLDLPICKKFEKMLKTIYPKINTEIVNLKSQNDIIVRISQLEYMIAMRFHAVLVAIKTGVKTIAITYDAKVAKLAYDALLPIITISIEDDMTQSFERVKQLNSEELIQYANAQTFDWKLFDDVLA